MSKLEDLSIKLYSDGADLRNIQAKFKCPYKWFYDQPYAHEKGRCLEL